MLGSKLKQARESRQLTLREIEWATKIRADFLQALEEEQFDRLPSATHARGFLRSYARYLELDADALVDDFNHSSGSAREIVSTRPAVRPRRRDVAVTPGMIVAVAMLVLVAVFGWYLFRQFQKYQALNAANAGVSPQLHLSQLPSPTPTLAPSPSPSPSASPSPAGVVVGVRLDADAWLSIDVDGKPSPETGPGRTFAAGSTLTFTGTQTVQVFTGRAAHTFITLNGRDLGPMPVGANGTGNKTYTRGQT